MLLKPALPLLPPPYGQTSWRWPSRPLGPTGQSNGATEVARFGVGDLRRV
jgi:hypothetical protein